MAASKIRDNLDLVKNLNTVLVLEIEIQKPLSF